MSKTLSVGVLINGLRNVIQCCAPLIYHNSRGMHDEHFMCIMICVFSSLKTFKLWHFCLDLIAFGRKLKRNRISGKYLLHSQFESFQRPNKHSI